MRLGELIQALKKLDPDRSIAAGHLHSYRGYYEQLSVNHGEPRPVRVFLEEAQAALGAEFTGWKGGEFVMSEATPVWLSEEGFNSGIALVGLLVTGETVSLHGEDIDGYA